MLSESVLAGFTEETGLTVEIVTGGDAGTMVAGAVLAAGSPTADVMFGVDNTLLSRALDAGVFEPYTPADIDVVAPELREGTADGAVTPIDYGDVCVNIDDATLADLGVAPPTTLEDLVKPEYRDLLVVQDPGTSSPGLAFLLATIARFGDGWQDYWQQLSDNGVKVASSWTDAYVGDFSGGGDGDRPLVVSYATSPPAEIVYAAEPKPTEPSTSVMTDGCYRQVEYAGVLAGAANPDGGARARRLAAHRAGAGRRAAVDVRLPGPHRALPSRRSSPTSPLSSMRRSSCRPMRSPPTSRPGWPSGAR